MPLDTDHPTEAQAVANLALRTAEVRQVAALDRNGPGLLALPDGVNMHSVEAFMPRPLRIDERLTIKDPVSWLNYLRRHPTELALLLVSTTHLRCVLDAPHGGEPAWGSHIAELCPEETRAYKLWRGALNKPMDHKELVTLLDSGITDVVEPRALDLMAALDTFRVSREVQFSTATRLRDGTVELQYTEKDKAQEKAKLPEQIKVMMPRWVAADAFADLVSITVKLRYRLDSGKVTFTLVPSRDSLDAIDAQWESFVIAVSEAAELSPVWVAR